MISSFGNIWTETTLEINNTTEWQQLSKNIPFKYIYKEVTVVLKSYEEYKFQEIDTKTNHNQDGLNQK